jgi:hypothetical protein
LAVYRCIELSGTCGDGGCVEAVARAARGVREAARGLKPCWQRA